VLPRTLRSYELGFGGAVARMAHSRSDVGGAILRLPGENERAAVIIFHGGETPDRAAPC
jgi:hypothetical protein